MIEPDFIPEDGKVCTNCKFYAICPYDWECETLKRADMFEEYDKFTEYLRNVRDGNSTKEVRE